MIRNIDDGLLEYYYFQDQKANESFSLFQASKREIMEGYLRIGAKQVGEQLLNGNHNAIE